MSVLSGEGSTVILYGSTSIVAGPRIVGGYLARPDLEGEWPTVIVVPPEDDISGSVKDLCRNLARHGFAALAVAERGQLSLYESFVTNPAGDWSNAELGFGVISLGDGSEFVEARGAGGHPLTSVAMLSPVAAPGPDVDVPVLVLIGGAEEDQVEPVPRQQAENVEWVIYGDAGPEFWDIAATGYDGAVAADAFERMTEFFASRIPRAS